MARLLVTLGLTPMGARGLAGRTAQLLSWSRRSPERPWASLIVVICGVSRSVPACPAHSCSPLDAVGRRGRRPLVHRTHAVSRGRGGRWNAAGRVDGAPLPWSSRRHRPFCRSQSGALLERVAELGEVKVALEAKGCDAGAP